MLFQRAEYKKQAKALLKGRRGGVIGSVIFSVVVLALLIVLSVIATPDYLTPSYLAISAVFFTATYVLSRAALLSFSRLCIKLHESTEKAGFAYFMKGFSYTIEGTLASFWRELWTGLWSLLFIIPGIVKGYSYSMMLFALAENPKIGAAKALNISKIMTRGHKGDLFVMDLSFLGWHLLSVLTCGILYLWIAPYIAMTKTEAYYALKKEALDTGALKPEDFEVPEDADKKTAKKIVLFIVVILVFALCSVAIDLLSHEDDISATDYDDYYEDLLDDYSDLSDEYEDLLDDYDNLSDEYDDYSLDDYSDLSDEYEDLLDDYDNLSDEYDDYSLDDYFRRIQWTNYVRRFPRSL